MKHIKPVKKDGEEEDELRKSNIDGMNFIKIYYMHVWQYHSETLLCN
jgi:hypothetical protein